MLDTYDSPVPQSPTIDQVLRDLTEHAGYTVADDGELDQTFAKQPHLILAWVAAAARYTAAECQLQMLHHPITWMRMELAPTSDQDTDELDIFADNVRRLLTEHGKLRTARSDAHRDFSHACPHLEAQHVLVPTDRQWQQIQLIAHGLTEPMPVEVPTDAAAPWPLVKADQQLINKLAALPAQPQPDTPALQRSLAGIVRLDHHGARQWVLPDPEHRYWLHDFAWSAPPGDEDKSVCSRQLVLAPAAQLLLAPPHRLARPFGPTRSLLVLLLDAVLAWSRWGQNKLVQRGPNRFARTSVASDGR